MPRDISGNYTLPLGNPVVDGTIISTSWANPTLADIAVQLNNVITRDGVLGFLSPIKAVDGTAAAPAYTFNAEVTLGMYRESAGTIAFSTSSTKRLTINGAGVTSIGTPGAAMFNVLANASTAIARFDGPSTLTTNFVEFASDGANVGHIGDEAGLIPSAPAGTFAVRGMNGLALGGQSAGGLGMHFDTSNRIGIGVIAEAGSQVVIDYVGSDTKAGLVIRNTGSGSPVPAPLLTLRLSNTSIGAAQPAIAFLDAAGGATTRFQVYYNGGIANFSANNVNLSSRVLKEHIVEVGSYLEKLCAISIKQFNYKGQSRAVLGVIAEEVELVAPELVNSDTGAIKGIYLTDLQYAMLQGIQELAQRVTNLEAAP